MTATPCTSARIIGNAQDNAPQLPDDSTDGKAARAVQGYKIMFMSRAYSLTHAARRVKAKRFGVATARFTAAPRYWPTFRRRTAKCS
ncbi:hypothetical protein [Neisseria yangbaofengii]|uniref:hypothetical protein n=1 Tax=Neisseria yangbaofengii TaxID=2709396 RepID=UPI0013EE2307|nr:hypothetical protein [Neisseria yangbaofengii]